MATLERPPPTESTPLDNISELTATVPTPFPSQERSSRSPSSSRLGGLMSKVRRSFSRDRTVGDSMSEEIRGRSGGEVTEDPRGRTSISFMPPLRATQTNTTMNTTTTNGSPRPYSTGRGGAGNIRSPSRGRQLDPILGEEHLELGAELPSVVAQAREDSASRSRSRGRVEVVASGRGGRGNIRSPSTGVEGREREMELVREEKEVEERRAKEGPGVNGVSSGRGGRGNIITPKSKPKVATNA